MSYLWNSKFNEWKFWLANLKFNTRHNILAARRDAELCVYTLEARVCSRDNRVWSCKRADWLNLEYVTILTYSYLIKARRLADARTQCQFYGHICAIHTGNSTSHICDSHCRQIFSCPSSTPQCHSQRLSLPHRLQRLSHVSCPYYAVVSSTIFTSVLGSLHWTSRLQRPTVPTVLRLPSSLQSPQTHRSHRPPSLIVPSALTVLTSHRYPSPASLYQLSPLCRP